METYAVVENTPGCLPESEPVWFTDGEEARDYARELVHEIVQFYEESGSACTVERDGYVTRVVVQDDHSLGRVVEIITL